MDKLIGTGRLSWNSRERRTDRYGSVYLLNADDTCAKLTKYEGYGKLKAVVIETRESRHIGDISHGFFPQTPNIDEIIYICEGYIFYDEDETGEMVGLMPKDGRTDFWLDPKMLYRCHDQTVELYFEEVTDVK